MAVDVRPDQDLTTNELIANTTEAQKFLARSFRRRDDEPLATSAASICEEAADRLRSLLSS